MSTIKRAHRTDAPKPLGMDDDGKLVYGGGVTGDMPTRPYVYCEHGIPEEQCMGCNGARLDQQARVIRRLERGLDRVIEQHVTGDPRRAEEIKTWALKGDNDAEAIDG